MSLVPPDALLEAVEPLVEGLAPMVLPLLLGVLADELDDGVLDEPEALEDGVLLLEEGVLDELDGEAVELEPLAPIDVPLLLGVLADELLLGVLADELDVSLELLGAALEVEPLGLAVELELLGLAVELELLGVAVELELEPLAAGVVLPEPDAPIVLVDGSFGFVPVAPAGEALVLLAPEPEGAAPAAPLLWAMAKPPKANAAAAATVVRVVLIMCRTPWFNCPRGGSMGMAPA